MGIFQRANRWVVCVNTHLDFTETIQEKSARLILSRLSGLAVTDPAVIVGDFNTSPDSRCYRLFTGNMPGSRIRNAFKSPFPGTHHGFTGKTNGGHIDWVLYRGAIVPDQKKVLRDDFNGYYPSDHFPLWVHFRWVD
jgi:endonuclease/exonuclease/phosphatase family metal-dependent hydrolase